MLCGLALLPSQEASEALIDFRNEMSSYIGGPKLGLTENLPHVSVIQCPFDPDQLTSDEIESILESFSFNSAMKGTFSVATYQPVGWIFADVVHDRWLDLLQGHALDHLKELIADDEINLEKTFSGYSDKQIAYYSRFGYRYIGEEYRPHVTLGRTLDGERRLAPEVVRAFSKKLAGLDFSFTRLAFYEAGESGTFSREIAGINI